MSTPEEEPWRPRSAPGIVLRHDRIRGTDLLLLPERVVVLKGSAGRIIRLCDGSRSVDTIVRELSDLFPSAPVQDDVLTFLRRLRQEGWIR
jgi:pyrroloquinoline quinone biosynthesis protein D